MQKSDHSDLYQRLRQEYPVFEYQHYSVEVTPEGVYMEFVFNLGSRYTFRPKAFIPVRNLQPESLDYAINQPGLLNNIAFNIGMIELISYWKATCAPVIKVKPASLTPEQVNWWKKLYFNGMGEFFYMNSLSVDADSFVEIIPEVTDQSGTFPVNLSEGILVPLGGGKDSVVTLEILKKGNRDIMPLIMNPRGATVHSATAGGFDNDDIFSIQRNIDPLLLKLNEQGFLNGHTPFSAMLAFYTLMAALLSGYRHIALSNESSANEATVPGTKINHQYSKSFEFESAFRDYCNKYISPGFNYFSFLRPLGELQIAKIFSGLKQYHEVFRSCNAGSKTDSWCGKCPKCLFTSIILSPFAGIGETARMLGHDMLNDPEMQDTFDELCGIAENKPFECVGTIDEVNNALQMMLQQHRPEELPLLLKKYEAIRGRFNPEVNFSALNSEHCVPPQLLNLLKEALQ
ncbi:hypothetical protein [Lentimicrobium sp.]|uniref:hypothetical protein n=1 Tax=Lentimicrobium sp. TaxID=2034841 RepID=UPI002CFF9BAF|nr:hypothetical protein [Lentimicrobium sp.]HPF65395.1 hypothetical protein [Lentimicrobium sp.]